MHTDPSEVSPPCDQESQRGIDGKNCPALTAHESPEEVHPCRRLRSCPLPAGRGGCSLS